MSNGDVSLMNGDHTATDDSIATGGGGSAAKLKSKHILVIGDTESGKTTLLSALKGVSPTSAADKTASGKVLIIFISEKDSNTVCNSQCSHTSPEAHRGETLLVR